MPPKTRSGPESLTAPSRFRKGLNQALGNLSKEKGKLSKIQYKCSAEQLNNLDEVIHWTLFQKNKLKQAVEKLVQMVIKLEAEAADDV